MTSKMLLPQPAEPRRGRGSRPPSVPRARRPSRHHPSKPPHASKSRRLRASKNPVMPLNVLLRHRLLPTGRLRGLRRGSAIGLQSHGLLPAKLICDGTRGDRRVRRAPRATALTCTTAAHFSSAAGMNSSISTRKFSPGGIKVEQGSPTGLRVGDRGPPLDGHQRWDSNSHSGSQAACTAARVDLAALSPRQSDAPCPRSPATSPTPRAPRLRGPGRDPKRTRG